MYKECVCPFCEEGNGAPTIRVNNIKLAVCDTCGSEFITEEMHDHNLKVIQNEKHQNRNEGQEEA